MGSIPTVKVKAEDGHKIINVGDFDPRTHEPFDDEARNIVGRQIEDDRVSREDEDRRRRDANRGQIDGGGAIENGRNPSGTFSEPTPTDIRYPDKTATEFENNMGAFIGKSAAGIREEVGLPDAPGGLKPEVHEQVQADQDAATLAAARAAKEAREPKRDPIAEARETAAERSTEAAGDLSGKTVAELREHAASRNIDLGEATKKADILAAIEASGSTK